MDADIVMPPWPQRTSAPGRRDGQPQPEWQRLPSGTPGRREDLACARDRLQPTLMDGSPWSRNAREAETADKQQQERDDCGICRIDGIARGRGCPATSPVFSAPAARDASEASRAAVPKGVDPVNPANPAIVFPAVVVSLLL